MMKRLSLIFLAAVGFVFMFNTGLAQEAAPRKVIVFHAGSLSVPFEKIEKNFEALYPEIDVLREAAGSTACARKITDLKKPCDIMASADYKVIDKFLMPEWADWNARFASNSMVLAYTGSSRFADTVNFDNWFDILATKGVVWGHSDPNLDPCGYRALFVLQLAGIYYRKPDLYQKAVDNRPEGNIRPKSVELVSLLQTGNMDYAWEYRSVAVQHGLKFLELPAEINLSDPGQENFYRQAKVKVTGEKPGEVIEMVGQSITYGITLLRRAPEAEAAATFLGYLLAPEGGLKTLKEDGQTPFMPPLVPSQAMWEKLPRQLKPLIGVGQGE